MSSIQANGIWREQPSKHHKKRVGVENQGGRKVVAEWAWVIHQMPVVIMAVDAPWKEGLYPAFLQPLVALRRGMAAAPLVPRDP